LAIKFRTIKDYKFHQEQQATYYMNRDYSRIYIYTLYMYIYYKNILVN